MSQWLQAVDYIQSLDRVGTPQHQVEYHFGHGIARARHLLTRLGGAPRATTRCVLVAGSKGKGSSVAMLSSILAEAGYCTAAFTGPHLHTPLERFAVDRQRMAPAEFIAFAGRVQAIVGDWDRPDLGQPTRFEAYTAIAYRYFEERGADIAVMEIGIGGRRDAVNLGEPLVSLITNLSLEHTAMLGSTLGEIAHEKAGILRPGRRGVSTAQTPEAAGALRREAAAIGARLDFAGERVRLAGCRVDIDSGAAGQWFTLDRLAGQPSPEPFYLPLLGPYQLENAAGVLAALEALAECGLPVDDQAIRDGLRRVRWPGRFEVLGRQPLVIADGAHTPYSMEQLGRALRLYFSGRRLHLILGVLRDKDAAGILVAAGGVADSLTFTQAQARRAVPAAQLLDVWRSLPAGRAVRAAVAPEGLAGAFRRVHAAAAPDDVICIAGTLHLAAEAEDLFGGPVEYNLTPGTSCDPNTPLTGAGPILSG